MLRSGAASYRPALRATCAPRDIASLLVETAGDRPRVPIARSDNDRVADMDATFRQLEHELKRRCGSWIDRLAQRAFADYRTGFK